MGTGRGVYVLFQAADRQRQAAGLFAGLRTKWRSADDGGSDPANGETSPRAVRQIVPGGVWIKVIDLDDLEAKARVVRQDVADVHTETANEDRGWPVDDLGTVCQAFEVEWKAARILRRSVRARHGETNGE